MGKRVGRSGLAGPIFFTILLFSLFLNGYFLIREESRTTVVSVPDGDSLDTADGRRIRLLGIDAPERNRCGYAEAGDFLRSIALGKRVQLEDTVKDDYGRILANVTVGNSFLDYIDDLFSWVKNGFKGSIFPQKTLLNSAMTAVGLARFRSVSSRYDTVIKFGQDSAQKLTIGIWSTACRQNTPSDPGRPVKGNVRSGVRHAIPPGCTLYGQTIVDLSYGDQWFGSIAEAEKEGFPVARQCRTKR